jgi:cell division transport system permease protein
VNRHSWREVRRQFRESGAAGVVAVLLLTVATTWGGVLWCVRQWVANQLLAPHRPASIVVVTRDTPGARTLEAALQARFASVRAVLTPPETVRDELAHWFPELAGVLLGLDSGSFPTLLELDLPTSDQPAVTGWLATRPEVALVARSQDWEARVQQAVSRVLIAGLALAVALLVGCSVVVLLVVRLLVVAHADEIAIMRLIGAHERQIRMPYLACGSLLGLLGGVLGVVVLIGLVTAARTWVAGLLLPTTLLAILPGIGAAAGALGAALGLAALPEEP